jgi:hypothetical protein
VEDRAVMKKEGCAVDISITDEKKEEVVITKDICVAVIDIVENVGIVVVPKQADIAESTRLVLLAFLNRERMHY